MTHRLRRELNMICWVLYSLKKREKEIWSRIASRFTDCRCNGCRAKKGENSRGARNRCQQTCEGWGQSDPLQADLTFWKEHVDLSALYAFDVRIPMDVKTVDSITTSKVLSGIGAWQHCPGKSLYLWDTAQRLRQRAPGATRCRRCFEDELPT